MGLCSLCCSELCRPQTWIKLRAGVGVDCFPACQMASVFRYATRVTQAVLRAAESPAARTAGCAARPRSAVAVGGRNTIARRYFSQHRRFSTAGKGKPTEVVEATEATEVGAAGARPTDAAAAAGAGAGATGETGNFFFDNPGLFAALFIGSVIGYFYYNKRGADLRTSIIASIDEEAAVSPREIRQLRDDNSITCVASSCGSVGWLVMLMVCLCVVAWWCMDVRVFLRTDKFDKLTKAALAEFPDGPIPYDEFNRLVVEHLFDNASQLVHWGVRGFFMAVRAGRVLDTTLCSLGQHHLERVLKFLQIHRDPENAGLDARVSLVAISLGLKAKAKDRVPALFNVYSQDGETISRQDFVACVGAWRSYAACSPGLVTVACLGQLRFETHSSCPVSSK